MFGFIPPEIRNMIIESSIVHTYGSHNYHSSCNAINSNVLIERNYSEWLSVNESPDYLIESSLVPLLLMSSNAANQHQPWQSSG